MAWFLFKRAKRMNEHTHLSLQATEPKTEHHLDEKKSSESSVIKRHRHYHNTNGTYN